MIEPIIMIGVVFYFFTKSIFCKPEEKSKPTEDVLCDALAKYLKDGVKIKTEIKK
jgi:hypothetical protein